MTATMDSRIVPRRGQSKGPIDKWMRRADELWAHVGGWHQPRMAS
jgi:hypothetical protein